jgi:hypothetical protein
MLVLFQKIYLILLLLFSSLLLSIAIYRLRVATFFTLAGVAIGLSWTNSRKKTLFLCVLYSVPQASPVTFFKNACCSVISSPIELKLIPVHF